MAETLSPMKLKTSLKNLKFIPKFRRRKTEVIRNTIRSNIKTEEEKEKEQKMKTKLFRQSNPFNICLDALKSYPNNRSE